MSRRTETFIPTLREDPADSESASHRLLLRAGMVRQLGAGLWTWLPAGFRSIAKVEQIIREEMVAIGGQEMLLPLLQPAEIWKTSGRFGVEEIFKLQDRRDSELVLGMTHEEPITWHLGRDLRSYRDLPLILFQIQLKERDEPRPRAGVLRTREFSMKDSYSFDCDQEGLEESYAKHISAYDRIFDRCELSWHRVASDVGMMGGAGADEYMAPCEAGEDQIALAANYAANVEVAVSTLPNVEMPNGPEAPEPVSTPGLKTVAEVADSLGLPQRVFLKAVPVVAESKGLTLCLVPGDRNLNELKVASLLGEPVRQATEDEIEGSIGPTGFIGPVEVECPVICDSSLTGDSYVSGANRADEHLRGVRPGRDFECEMADIRAVATGDLTDSGAEIEIVPAIEIGNIFKLGTRYSEALGATFLDEQGKELPVVMGSYGIGPARAVAASIEQRADEKGISWPKALAPWEVALVSLAKEGEGERAIADEIYSSLEAAGVEVLYDDRDASAGEKLTDAELIGCPLRVVAGRKSLAEGKLETEVRNGGEKGAISIDDATERIVEILGQLD